MSKVGATPDTELILYGDFNNWFGAFAFWVFRYYGHKKIKIMNGGRKKWEMEKREYTKQDPTPAEGRFSSRNIAQPPDEGVRAYLPDVKRAMEKAETVLVDVRSPKEFTGKSRLLQNILWNMHKEAVIFRESKCSMGSSN